MSLLSKQPCLLRREKVLLGRANYSSLGTRATRKRRSINETLERLRERTRSFCITRQSYSPTYRKSNTYIRRQKLNSHGNMHRRLSDMSCIKAEQTKANHPDGHIQTLESGYRANDILWSILAAIVLGTGYFYVTDTRSSIHRYVLVPLMRIIFPDAEDASKPS